MTPLKPVIVRGIVLLMLLPAGAAGAAEPLPTPEQVKSVIGHPGPVPVPPDRPLSAARVALGKQLFSDTRLSGDGSVSCETCHLPDHGYATPARSTSEASPTRSSTVSPGPGARPWRDGFTAVLAVDPPRMNCW